MSYSVSVANVAEVHGDNGIEKALLAAFDAAYTDPAKEVRDAVQNAADEAPYLAENVLGGEGPFSVSLSWHAKLGDDDTAPPFVTLSIHKSTPPVEEPADEPAAEAEVEAEPAAAK